MNVLVYIFICLFHSTWSASCGEENYLSDDPKAHLQATFDTQYGDYNLNVLMSLTSGGQCNQVTRIGLLKVFAIQHIIEEINNNSNFLKNITLGYKFDDACLSLPLAMSKGIEITQQYRQKECIKRNTDTCSATTHTTRDIHAIIGASFSFITIPLASLFALHNMPIISPEASSPLLKKTNFYESFFRTIPPDTYTIEAIMDIVLHFKWTYIFAIGSDDDYGKVAITELKRIAALNDICITGDMYIPFEAEDTKIIAKNIAAELQNHPTATVVVMFNYAFENGAYIIEEADRMNLSRIWLTGDAWNPDALTSNNIPKRQLQNIISVSWMYGEPSVKFIDFINDTISNNFQCNHILLNYIMHKYNCIINGSDVYYLKGYQCNNTICKLCQVSKLSLFNEIKDANIYSVNTLIDALYATSYGLESIIKARCTNNSNCKPIIQPSELSEALKTVSFTNQRNELFEFDTQGNPKYFSYSIDQIQIINEESKYISVGEWNLTNSKKLQLHSNKFNWSSWPNNSPPKSSCSVDCQFGEYVTAKQGCCWVCEKCPENKFNDKINSEQCFSCPAGYYTKDGITCQKTLISYLKYKDIIGISAIFLSCIGIAVVLCLILLAMCHGILKRDSLESKIITQLTNILLLITFSYSVLHVIKPKDLTCQVQYAYFHLVLIVYNSILLVKNSSVSHFLSKHLNKKKKVWFTQIMLFLVIILIEMAMLTAWIVKEDQFIEIDESKQPEEYFQKCLHNFNTFRILIYGFPSLVLLIATVQSIAERKTLSKHGESRFLMFTCFCFAIINIAYFITLSNVAGVYQEMVVVFTVIIYGFAYIACMVIPKLYNTLIRSNKNNNQQSGVLNIGFERESCYYVNKNNVNATPVLSTSSAELHT